MRDDEFNKWLKQRTPSGGGKPKIRILHTTRPADSMSPAWSGASGPEEYELLGHDDLGLIVVRLGDPDDQSIFYPWASIFRIE